MTGSGREGFFSGFHAMDKVLDDVRSLSTFKHALLLSISSLTTHNSLQNSPLLSTTQTQFSFTARLQVLAQHTAWSVL